MAAFLFKGLIIAILFISAGIGAGSVMTSIIGPTTTDTVEPIITSEPTRLLTPTPSLEDHNNIDLRVPLPTSTKIQFPTPIPTVKKYLFTFPTKSPTVTRTPLPTLVPYETVCIPTQSGCFYKFCRSDKKSEIIALGQEHKLHRDAGDQCYIYDVLTSEEIACISNNCLSLIIDTPEYLNCHSSCGDKSYDECYREANESDRRLNDLMNNYCR